MQFHEVTTPLTDEQIARRVEQVKAYERFAVFVFRLTDEHQANRALTAERIQVTSADGSVYFGIVEDYDDSRYYVNLR